MRKWSEQELTCLKEKYPTTKPKLLGMILANRSVQSIYKKATTLNLHRQRVRHSKQICNQCNASLTNENWYPSAKKHGSYFCKQCINRRHNQNRKKAIPLATGICRYCNTPLTETNWSLWNRTTRYHCCVQCNRKQAKTKYLSRKGKIRETLITTKINGVPTVIRTRKRCYTNTCEVCGNIEKTAYHHWDNKNPHWGMWLCWKCHMLAEGLDEKGIILAEKYLKFKPVVESNWTIWADTSPTSKTSTLKS